MTTASSLVVASVTLAELPPSALASHKEAAEWFKAGHSISQAAAQYASASDTFFARVMVWLAQQGALSAPATDGGKCPRLDTMSSISEDSKNAARQYAQQVYSAGWELSRRGLDVFQFASLRAMRDAIKAKGKTVPNGTVSDGISGASSSEESASAVVGVAPAAAKLEVAADDLAVMLEYKNKFAELLAEINREGASIKSVRAKAASLSN